MDLWTSPTPNGWKVTILIEELREAGHDLSDLKVHTVNLAQGEHKTQAFTDRNPNQKIKPERQKQKCECYRIGPNKVKR